MHIVDTQLGYKIWRWRRHRIRFRVLLLTFWFTQVSLAALLDYFAVLSFAGKNISFECRLFPQNRRSFCALNKGLI
jgi:hypothetical protein